ncbi:hypothetical protein Rhe02_07930 [Rhizocola hellebori]|uniref:Uncharacterized protein n=1 Tax=Rhizocola hellebori TaxID=1392758 RepID=A0A8J3VDT8_9ACTN|nr:hypothetical protein [Rhizocola hellebori]GIH02726.1 hypothetical protein Rhe02_07930 [Rhizocola hellebori]
MPEASLGAPARQALLALLLFGAEAATNTALHERFALKIAKDAREQLVSTKLITAHQGKGGAFFHTLTDKGRDRATEELATQAPAGTSVGVRLLYAMANVLSNVMAQHGIKTDQVFGDEPAPEPGPAKTEYPQSVEHQIQSTYARLAKRRGELVSLVKLRGNLPMVPRDVLNKTLKAMDRQRTIQLDPDPNTKALPQEAHDAAIRVGGEDKHFISMGAQ